VSHILIAAFGSAGDMLPAIAVAQAIQAKGHRATLFGTRVSGFYGRAVGLPTVAIGDGGELAAVSDAAVRSTRFDGYGSWRTMASRYLDGLHRHCYEEARTLVAELAPDAVAVHSLFPLGSLLATELGIPWASVHLHPQLSPEDRSSRPGHWGGPLASWIRTTERRLGVPSSGQPLLRWSWSDVNLSVHDPALVAATELASMPIGEPCGFPYWDGLPVDPADREVVDHLTASGDRIVVVTLGSFLGRSRSDFWARLSETRRGRKHPTLLVGVPRAERPALARSGVSCTGFVPMSSVLPHADVAVHHGGIGTSYAALRHGVPAVVVPQAFDQSFNGRLLESAGVGRVLRSRDDLGDAIAETLSDHDTRNRSGRLASSLVPAGAAADRIADGLLAVAA
jgi:rhamnosyltransferase subunit B